MCQGSPGDRGWLRQLLQDPFQVLGDLGEGSTSARFHLMGGNRDSFIQCSSKRRSLHFPPTTWSRKALPTDGWGVVGRKRVRLLHCSNGWPGAGRVAGSHPPPGSGKQARPGQSPAGTERRSLQVCLPWVLLLTPNQDLNLQGTLLG